MHIALSDGLQEVPEEGPVKRLSVLIFYVIPLWILLCTGLMVYGVFVVGAKTNIFGKLTIAWLAGSLFVSVSIDFWLFLQVRWHHSRESSSDSAQGAGDQERRSRRLERLAKWATVSGVFALGTFVLGRYLHLID